MGQKKIWVQKKRYVSKKIFGVKRCGPKEFESNFGLNKKEWWDQKSLGRKMKVQKLLGHQNN